MKNYHYEVYITIIARTNSDVAAHLEQKPKAPVYKKKKALKKNRKEKKQKRKQSRAC
jgi:hypothetical protein